MSIQSIAINHGWGIIELSLPDLIVIEHIIKVEQICFSFQIFELAVETIERLNFNAAS